MVFWKRLISDVGGWLDRHSGLWLYAAALMVAFVIVAPNGILGLLRFRKARA